MSKKSVLIFGAGQVGTLLFKYHSKEIKIEAFCDNDINKQGKKLFDKLIISWEEALKIDVDEIWLAVLDDERKEEIEDQILSSSFDKKIVDFSSLFKNMDMRLCLSRYLSYQIEERNIGGDIAELGVYRGDFAADLNSIFQDRKLHLFDTFTGFDSGDLEKEDDHGKEASKYSFSDTSLETVKGKMKFLENVEFYVGRFPETIPDKDLKFSFVSLDTDLYMPTYEGLKYFYPRLSRGGYIFIHDYNSLQFSGVKKAVDKYCRENSLFILPMADLHGSAVLIKN